MSGLLIKDFFIMKKLGRQCLLVLLMLAFYGILFKNVYIIQGMMIIMVSNIMISSMNFDEMVKWDKYVLTMPVSRRCIVRSKFLFLIINVLVTIIIGVAGSWLMGVILSLLADRNGTPAPTDFSLPALLAIGLSMGGAFLVLLSVVLTAIFKLGTERTRMIIMIVYFIPFIIVVLGTSYLKKLEKPEWFDGFVAQAVRYLPIIAAALVIAGVFICYLLSVKIYEKKEFN